MGYWPEGFAVKDGTSRIILRDFSSLLSLLHNYTYFRSSHSLSGNPMSQNIWLVVGFVQPVVDITVPRLLYSPAPTISLFAG